MVKIGPTSAWIKITNNKNSVYLHDEANEGKEIDYKYGGGGGEFKVAPGRYHLKVGRRVAVIPVEIKAGEEIVVDVSKHVGTFRMLNNRGDQYLYDQSDKEFFDISQNEVYELPPGRYRVRNSINLLTVEQFEIKAGEETVLDFAGNG